MTGAGLRERTDGALHGGRAARAYAAAVVRLRWLIVGGWIILAAGVTVALPTLSETGGSGGFAGLASPSSPAIQAEIRSFEKFGFPVLARAAVVQRNPEGLPLSTQLRVLSNALEFNLDRPPELRRIEFALPIVNTLDLLPAQERGTTAITYLFYRPTVGFGRQTGLANEYADRYAAGPDDYLVGETGVVPGRVAQLVILREQLHRVEVVTVGLIILVVAINFVSVGAPLLTMTTAGLALALIVRIAGWLGKLLGFDVPSEIEPIIVALLLGIVTDYSIFYLSGMRQRLAQGDDRLAAARHSAAEFGPIVVVAGLTVAAGSLAVLVAGVGAFRAFGPGMALTILISLAVAVTFVPACLAIFGNAIFWPRRARVRPESVPRVSPLVRAITNRRGAVVAVALTATGLGVLALPVRNLELGFSVIESLPASFEARQAAKAAGEGFSPGILSPTVLLIEGEGVTAQRDGLARLQGVLETRPGIAGVAGPADLPNPLVLGAVLAPTGDAARYVIVFDEDPLSASAINQVTAMRAEMPSLLAQAGLRGVTGSFAGDTAVAEETVTQTEEDLGAVVLVAIGLGLVLLVLFLRSLVAPLYLMAANLLALGATLGFTTFVFQTLGGDSGITFYVPFAAAVLLVALGADYSIFGIGYIWAEGRRRPLIEAIRVATPRSTRAITAAGITLAVSFAVLALVPLTPFREFALAMSVGILIDVFVVRSVLVPSLVTLVGTASAWPGRALRGGRAPAALPAPVGAMGPPRGRELVRLVVGLARGGVAEVLSRRRR